uniref:Carboxylic ester hydrolase n=1 Tax=Oryctolagus cuniculus TaxID=9986 RepID=Q28681_RABIT|nr:cholesterin esterase [Oryctolagus cuniculus]
MAIAWVKANIAAFGGDPDNITIFGESAGGASVSLQTLSPYNKGLIRRAISQSGVALSPWDIQKNPLFWAKKIAEKVGCPLDYTATMAQCVKITDPHSLTLAYNFPLAGLAYPMVHYLGFIVVDGDFLPEDPIILYGNAADIDYLAGTNDMDGHLFATVDMPAIDKSYKDISDQDFYKLVSGMTVTKGSEGAQATYSIYTESWAQDSSQQNKKKTVDLETDILFLIPTEMALAQHRANSSTAKTYAYLFSHPSRMPIYPSWMGADHADDLQYIFGKPFATPTGYRPQDRTVSKTLIAYWTNFARTGDPNTGFGSARHWEPYTLENGSYLEINKKMSQDSTKSHLRNSFLQFWAGPTKALPVVLEDVPVPPTDDAEPSPGARDDSSTPPADDSVAAQMPMAIGF